MASETVFVFEIIVLPWVWTLICTVLLTVNKELTCFTVILGTANAGVQVINRTFTVNICARYTFSVYRVVVWRTRRLATWIRVHKETYLAKSAFTVYIPINTYFTRSIAVKTFIKLSIIKLFYQHIITRIAIRWEGAPALIIRARRITLESVAMIANKSLVGLSTH